MIVTKLDNYDYEIFPGIIRIFLSGMNDPDLVDIMSEIHRSEGRIYINGNRYLYLDNYKLISQSDKSFIDLDVEEK